MALSQKLIEKMGTVIPVVEMIENDGSIEKECRQLLVPVTEGVFKALLRFGADLLDMSSAACG